MGTQTTLQELYIHELKDAFSAEKQILKALPKMEKASGHKELQDAFRQHREVTEEHVRRLESILETLDVKPGGKKCKGMEGIIEEGEEMMKEAEGDTRDAALISAAQRVEHYEIAAYGTLRTFASQLGREEDARILQMTLDEEGTADHELSRLAESRINREATA